MPILNYSGEEINAKIVYYGPGLSGKTTNLDYIHKQMPAKAKGEMVSMKTRTDRTLFFDFLPLEFGEIGGYKTRFLLYTVPGQVYYNATRKLVLKGIDAAVFVADSSPSAMQDNIESLRNLEDNLNEYGLSLDNIPWVIQYNKRDVDEAISVVDLHQNLNLLSVPAFEAVATEGRGVYETFESIAGLVYKDLLVKLERGEVDAPGSESTEEPVVEVVAVPEAVETGANDNSESSNPAASGGLDGFDDAIDNVLREMDAPAIAPDVTVEDTDSYEDVLAQMRCKDDIDNDLKNDGVQAAGSSPVPVAQPADSPPRDTMQVSKSAPISRQAAPAEPAEKIAAESTSDEAIFPTISNEKIDTDVGRTLELETVVFTDVAVEEAPAEGFITDPMSAPMASKDVVEEMHVTVPVVISRSQLRKAMSIKLVLEIEIRDT